jgi:hypothetical protein
MLLFFIFIYFYFIFLKKDFSGEINGTFNKNIFSEDIKFADHMSTLDFNNNNFTSTEHMG